MNKKRNDRTFSPCFIYFPIVPEGLRLLEHKIEEITNSSKWVKPIYIPKKNIDYAIFANKNIQH